MPDLKNCPCCGSDTVRYRDERGGRSVECIYCGLGTAIYGMGVAKHEVVGKWNRRAQPEGMVSISAADLRSIYQAVIDADEEGLAYHAEPMQRAREALERGEG